MRQIEIDGIEPIIFQRSERAKRIIISVRPNKGVRVAVPYGSSFREAECFVRSRTNWIREKLEIVKQAELEHEAIHIVPIDKPVARRQLIARLDKLASQHSFNYSKVSIRNQRSRWGSCSPRNAISLNIKLVKLPSDLMDYVILHELVHTRIKNHSKTFWDELDRYVGNAKQMDSRLKEFWLGML